ncbi:MAG: aldehyde dehydrogenase family protein, partial [Porticoccaceae bacterium]
MTFQRPQFKPQYENYIGGRWVAPIDGKYFEDTSPIDGKLVTRIPQSSAKDIDLAVKKAWEAFPAWGKTSAAARSAILNKIADTIEANIQQLAMVETCDNGKGIRETLGADLPLVIDQFRYFAAAIRTESGSVSDIDATLVSMEIHEPLGVVGQIIPWNFPLLMAAWKIAPALAAGNCVVLKPAEQTPVSILVLMELIGDLLPPGVLNVVNGFGAEAGKPLASHPDIKKIAFTGETTTGRLIMQYASENIIPVSLELGGKSPNIFCASVMDKDDAFLDKAIEGLVMFALNQ